MIPKPTLNENNLPDQAGRVILITGGYGGVGFELAKILYQHHATVWLAGRSESKGQKAIEALTAEYPGSRGSLHFLKIDLSDLTTIKPAAEEFQRQETKLHWLNNNAGVMHPPAGSKGAQGFDLQYQTNIYGPFLFTKLLSPILKRTAASEKPGDVRVTWAGSTATVVNTPPGGVAWKEDGSDLVHAFEPPMMPYHITKAANYLLAVEFGKRFGQTDGVMHLAYNPGTLSSDLGRTSPASIRMMGKMLESPVKMGAYTELYAGLSKDLTLGEDQGGWIVPWGRRYPMRSDIFAETKKEDGTPFKMFEWCDNITKKYA